MKNNEKENENENENEDKDKDKDKCAPEMTIICDVNVR
jgi:hypothetical protein